MTILSKVLANRATCSTIGSKTLRLISNVSIRQLSSVLSSQEDGSSLGTGDGIVKSDFDSILLPNQDICSYMFPRWKKWLERDALECLTTGQKMTYADLIDISLRWGGTLKRLVPDISPSSVSPTVAIFSPNVIEYWPVLFGTLAAGWSLSTINPSYKIGEVLHSLKTTEPKLLVVDPILEDLTDEALLKLKISIPVIINGPSKKCKPNLQELLQDTKTEKCDVKQVNPLDTALILQSGGTTGLPKSVAISHKSVSNSISLRADLRFTIFGGDEYPSVTNLGLMPFFHLYGLYIVFVTLHLGSKIIVFRNFDANTFGSVLRNHQVKCLHLVPYLLNFVVSSPLVTSGDLSSIRAVSIAASTVHPSAAHALVRKVDSDIIFQEGYGMTETLATHTTPKVAARIGFCGKLLPNFEAKIIDLASGKPLGPDSKGELLVRGPTLMTHYIKNPKATAETIDEEGFLHTGDVAQYNAEGYFNIIDRIKDLIKVKDLQVSPAEIEDALMEHPAVGDVGVVGIPDTKLGECPRAYVVLKGKASEEELVKFIKDRLSPHKRLTGGVEFVKELPKSQAGKILRRQLRDIA